MIIAALIKEFRLLSRDLHGIAVLFLMPMIFMLIMSLALSNADNVNKDLKVALVGSSDNQFNQEFIKSLSTQEEISVTQLPMTDLNKVHELLGQGSYEMVIVNPNLVQDKLADDKQVELHLLASTDRSRIASVKGVIQKVYIQQRLNRYFDYVTETTKEAQEKAAKKSRKTHTQPKDIPGEQIDSSAINTYLGNDLLSEVYLNIDGKSVKKPNSVQQSVPAWLIFGMFFIMIPLSNVMATEKITNTITRLRLAKASAFSLLMAKLIPYFLINQIQFVGMILIGIYILPKLGATGFELYGDYSHYALLSCAISLSALGYGLLVSVLAKSTEHAVVLGGGGNIIMAAIGGIMVPAYIMPEIMQEVTKLSPMSWALQGFHDLLLNQYTFEQILPQWLSLVGFGIAFLFIAYIIYSQQLKQQVRM